MTAPLRSTSHSQLSASQTAPVAEFRCLYTPDIRKKQKKWQDGYLKFHTFNNRVIVYDQARNFLGDTYYKDSNELHEGDELTLDKGVMVEVADAMGITQTDLAPLFEKKPREVPPPPSAPPRRFQPPSQVASYHVTSATNATRTNPQLRHKSLNTLLGTPKGPIGKSVPIKSPYQARQEKEKENDFAVDRAAKRRKTAHTSTSSVTLRLSSPVQEESPAPRKALPLCEKIGAKPARRPTKPIPQGVPVITLDELDAIAHINSDATIPSTPPYVTKVPDRPAVTPGPPATTLAVKKPLLQTPKIPRGKVPVPSVKALETPKIAAPTSSPPVSASNRLTNVGFAVQPTPVKEAMPMSNKQPSPPLPALPTQFPPRQPKAKSLRLSAGVKRGTLMICQPPPPPRAREASKRMSVSKALETSTRARSGAREHSSLAADMIIQSSALKAIRKAITNAADTANRANLTETTQHDIADTFDDDREVAYGLMDQQLIVSSVSPSTPPPEPILAPDSPEQAVPQPRITKPIVHKVRKSPLLKAKKSEPERAVSPRNRASKIAECENTLVEKPQPVPEPSPPAPLAVELSCSRSRAASPALSAISDLRSRTASMSPRKLEKPSVAPRNETVALPPHPLHANKKGPFMTTTELSATLQKPKRRTNAKVDSIEDDGAATGKSPDRKFRRVRSENDAPIPSTSDDWEKRNLPKSTPTLADTAPTEPAEVLDVVAGKKSGLAALVRKTDPRRKFVRTQSLNVDTNMQPAQDMDSPLASPVVDNDIGPWSTEAFDLFDWRPPPRSAEAHM
ncbi:hypothetical protein EJ07DRAFT_132737 [Lizonia empirigonia]|nr:hypothetical protein EJ07DRAFT_132737 [Lizonia empirigonia]